MQTYDRYLIRLFVRVLVVCFVSITGLYVVIDACSNAGEFMDYGQQQDGLLPVLADYYSSRVPWFFDQISALLTLIAAMFAIAWLKRSNEMTALMAAGIPSSRIVRPLIFAALAVSLMAAANREFMIPKVRDKLTRNAQDWLGERARTVEPVIDNQTGVLINGRYTFANEQRIERPRFRLHRLLGEFGRWLEASNAYYEPPCDQHAGGYRLREVNSQQIEGVGTAILDGLPVIYSPLDTEWLKQDECFVVSAVTFDQLSGGSQWRQLASTVDLIKGTRNPSLSFGLDARVTIHSRFVQPMLDMSLFLIGLPLVLSQKNRNIFVAAGWCLLLVVGFIMILMICHAAGGSGGLLSPVSAAWLPLLIFAPLATAVSYPIWE
ncbi:MAG TPA: LptF/LptG family permease [Pirellulaceae bacterium]|nr:LptF/LptG family permease [Pirellulaceae bacterium]